MRAIALALTVLAAGCSLANLTPQARFQDSAFTLNEASRWGAVDQAMEHVSPKYQDRFIERHREWGGVVSIADQDLVRLQVAEDRKSALSEVNVSWYRNNGITLRTSVVTQKWETDHGHFKLVDETVRVGDPGILAEPAPATASGTGPQG